MTSDNDRIINKIDKVTLFWYIVIIITIIFIFSKFDIKLNIVLGTLIAGVLILYLYNDYQIINKQTVELIADKEKLINPKPEKAFKYKRMVNYLFTIQDFFVYNPQVYEDFIENINRFFYVYEEIMVNNSSASSNYPILIDNKRGALNALQSITLILPPDVKYDIKLDTAVRELDVLLNFYLDEIKDIYNTQLYENGYDIKTKLLDNGPSPYNTYNDKYYTAELY